MREARVATRRGRIIPSTETENSVTSHQDPSTTKRQRTVQSHQGLSRSEISGTEVVTKFLKPPPTEQSHQSHAPENTATRAGPNDFTWSHSSLRSAVLHS